ncbi:MAG: MerR family transcriptional regulator [Corynebacterium sp.]|nr:MerR family transcriptional regulator [Corynebacterium sp.]
MQAQNLATTGVVPGKKQRTYTIGQVVERLQAEFPELSQSKVRFLEKQELLHPMRSTKGYRRYTDEDVERLHYVLTMQRDHYMPHKVLFEHLQALDAGKVQSLDPVMGAAPVAGGTLSLVELAEASGVGTDFLSTLLSQGLLSSVEKGVYTREHVRVVKAVHELVEAGVDLRQLAKAKGAASRQFDVIRSVTGAIARGHDLDAREHANETGRMIISLLVELNAALITNMLAEEERK